MAVLLDSAAPDPAGARYSVVAVDPIVTLDSDWRHGFDRLADMLAGAPRLRPAAGWPFGPGAFGVLGYELRRALERLPSRHAPEPGLADLAMGLFDTIIVFDVVARAAAIIAGDLDPRRPPAAARAASVAHALRSVEALGAADWGEFVRWTPDFAADEYAERVAEIRAYIAGGDVYQANFTQRWIAEPGEMPDPFGLYRRLRHLSPAPYGAFVQDGRGNAVLSASPEQFLKLGLDGSIETNPIKGTRPRGATRAADEALAQALSDSAKDHAENLMIVDLLRNDLGRVAEIGSVGVPALNRLVSFANVHHLVSTVRARLRPGLGPLDLIRACFPCGSVTGAPKIRAMELIDALEAGRRGAYCGAIGWIGLEGRMELSVAIRTVTVTGGRVVAQAGGGIVWDSDPMAEHEEALVKASPLLGIFDEDHRGRP